MGSMKSMKIKSKKKTKEMDDAEEEVKEQDGEETNERKARFGPSK